MGGQSGFKRFLNENKSLAVSIPILAVLLIAVVIIYFSLGSTKNQEAVPTASEILNAQAQTIEILPNTERATSDSNNEQKNTSSPKDEGEIKDPFSGPVSLTGVLVDSQGNGIAVIEANNKSYIVRKGDILENNMTVGSISEDKVILKDQDREITLKLEKRNNSQTAN
jgi:type II secretory pathway component PulC